MNMYLVAISAGLILLGAGSVLGQRTDIDQKVAYSVELATKNDLSAVYSVCEENGVSILPYFQRYIFDKNSDVRFAVETAATQFKSPSSEAMLLQLVSDKETYVAEDALRAFIRLFPLKELGTLEAEKLNDGLVLRAKRGDASGLSLLLLAYHSQTPNTIVLLNRLREAKSTTIGMINALPAERSTILDITLAQLKDKPANQRISELIRSSTVASVVDLTSAIPYMKNSRLLLQSIELLKDTRITERVRGGMGFSAPGSPVPPVTYHRVCDLALIAFASRNPSAIRIDVSKGDQRPFTQDELNESYNSLGIYYKS